MSAVPATVTTPLLPKQGELPKSRACYICLNDTYNSKGEAVDAEGQVNALAVKVLSCGHTLHAPCHEQIMRHRLQATAESRQGLAPNLERYLSCGQCRTPFKDQDLLDIPANPLDAENRPEAGLRINIDDAASDVSDEEEDLRNFETILPSLPSFPSRVAPWDRRDVVPPNTPRAGTSVFENIGQLATVIATIALVILIGATLSALAGSSVPLAWFIAPAVFLVLSVAAMYALDWLDSRHNQVAS